MGKPRWRSFRMALSTALGFRRQGFFIPYRHADDLPSAGKRAAYDSLEAIFASRRASFSEVLGSLTSLSGDLLAIGRDNPPEPRWDQVWFPGLDGAVAYAMTRWMTPKRIIEVGSGHSTRFFARAVRDGKLKTQITAIDPAPRATIETLPISIQKKLVHGIPLAEFDSLEDGDFLFIDSSHILMPGSDVDHLFNRVLPRLASGVFVHIHDIFLPDDYPADWDWRGYNEQLGVSTLIQGDGYDIIFASHYVATRLKDEVAGSVAGKLPGRDKAPESSLWLRKL